MCILFYLRQDFVIYARVAFSSLGSQTKSVSLLSWLPHNGIYRHVKPYPALIRVCVCDVHTHICMSECGCTHTIAHTFKQCVLSVLAFYSIGHRVSCSLPWTPGYLACKRQRILHPFSPSFAHGIL